MSVIHWIHAASIHRSEKQCSDKFLLVACSILLKSHFLTKIFWIIYNTIWYHLSYFCLEYGLIDGIRSHNDFFFQKLRTTVTKHTNVFVRLISDGLRMNVVIAFCQVINNFNLEWINFIIFFNILLMFAVKVHIWLIYWLQIGEIF